MKTNTLTIWLFLIFASVFVDTAAAQKTGTAKPASAPASVVKTEKEEFDAASALPPAERIEKLKAFVSAHPRSTLKARALELIVSAHAALGDEKLKAGDAAGGTEQFRFAVAAIPSEMSDKLFLNVVSQIPSNLFLRGQQAAAIEVARVIEERVKDNEKRLLNLAAFYLGIEAAEDALRVADLVIKQSPESSEAYQARAAAHRISLRLEESVADYVRALELSPKSEFARRSLAELRRATGKTEEALALYREILTVNATDEFARTGLVVSLFELGRKEEAEREFETALKDLPNSLALLAGTAYWFAAHNDSARAIELAQKAVQVEPRYTWGHIALARGLLAQRRPMEAERALIIARSYGRFPTLDYEMASVLAAAGLYGEAAATLSLFALKDGQIETWLAGRTLAHSDSFTDLLAPERRASIFQFTAADNEANAHSIKALLAFTIALNPTGGREARKESDVLAAARDFVMGDDDMRAFRRLYVAGRLLENDIALATALEMMEAVTSDVEPALKVPAASVAVMGEELRDARAQANLQGSTLSVPEIPRHTLSNIMRGRIEELAGWALFHQGKYAEAVVRLRRATSVLPDQSVWWRTSMWHLGASLEADGKGAEALEVYFATYKSGGPDPTRRAVIEGLYRRVNGSLDGLNDRIGPSTVIASNTAPVPDTSQAIQSVTTETSPPNKTAETPSADSSPKSDATSEPKVEVAETKPADATTTTGTLSEPKSEPAETKPVEAAPRGNVATEPQIVVSEAKAAEAAPTVDATTEPKPDTSKAAEASATPEGLEPTNQPKPDATPEPTPIEVPPGPPQPAAGDERHDTPTTPPTDTKPATEKEVSGQRRERRVSTAKCAIAVSESSLTIENNGGRAIIDITLEVGTSTEGVTAVTSDWSALAVFPEPKSATKSNVVSFSVTSISKKSGMFTVTFKSSCGSKDVTVTVR